MCAMKTTNKTNKSEMWLYLDALGVLATGSEEEIKAAKKVYRKNYLLKYKQRQRSTKPEFTVPLSKDKGEYSIIYAEAKRHSMTIGAFLKTAALAYINKTYVVPDRLQLAELEQLLAGCLNEIQNIVRKKERFYWDREQKYEAIEKRIEKLERSIDGILKQPSTLEELVIKEIEKKPTLREQLLFLLNAQFNDNQNKIS